MAKTSRAMRMAGNPTVTEKVGGAPIGRLQRLTPDSGRSELREALQRLPEESTFYYQRPVDGTFVEITKTRNGDYLVDGRRVDENQMVRKYTGVHGKNFLSERPDTSSSFAVTGRKVYTHGGLQFRNGTYDTLNNTGGGRLRKFSENWQITTYDGESYGVKKKSGSYSITHVGTGLALGNVKTMEDVAKRIKDTSDRVRRMPEKRKAEERLRNTVRGVR